MAVRNLCGKNFCRLLLHAFHPRNFRINACASGTQCRVMRFCSRKCIEHAFRHLSLSALWLVPKSLFRTTMLTDVLKLLDISATLHLARCLTAETTVTFFPLCGGLLQVFVGSFLLFFLCFFQGEPDICTMTRHHQ
jgi:hypothetical protein